MKDEVIDQMILEEMQRREQLKQKNIEEGEIIREGIGQNLKETAQDVLVTAPQGATLGGFDEILGLIDDDMGAKYRQAVEAARERSPYATFMGEELAETVTTGGLGKIAKGLKAVERLSDVAPPGSITRTIGKSAAQGALEGEEGQRAESAAITGAMGTAMHGAGRGVKRLFDDPKAILGRYFGVSKKGFEQEGSQELVETISDLNDMGAFELKPMKYEPARYEVNKKTGQRELIPAKYVPEKGGKRISRKNAKQVFRDRLDDTIRRLDKQNKDLLGVYEKTSEDFGINTPKLKNSLKNKMQKIYDVTKAPDAFMLKLTNKLNELEKAIVEKKQVRDLVGLRQTFQQDANSIYKAQRSGNAVTGKMTEEAKMDAAIAEWLNEVIEENAPRPMVIRANNLEMSRHIRVRDQIDSNIASERSKGGRLPFIYGPMDAIYKGAQAAGQAVLPRKTRAEIGKFVEDQDYEGMRQGAEDLIRNIGIRASERMQSPTYDDQYSTGRQPQSLANPIVEDQLLERDSSWIMQHPNLTRAVLLREAPDLAAQVSMALEKGDQRLIRKIMPQIAQQVPHVFEMDDFGIFDGKIIDPAMRNLYIQQLMEDPSLDSIEKAEKIDHLNRTNEVLE